MNLLGSLCKIRW